MKYIKSLYISVLVLVTVLHVFLLINFVKNNKEIKISKKETVQKLDLRNVTVKPKPKPKPKPKVKPKPKPKPKVKPKPKPKPKVKPKPKPDFKKEPQKEEKIEEVPIVQKPEVEPVVKKQTLSASEAELIKSQYIRKIKKIIESKKYYPRKAKRLHHEGIVELHFTISADGSIKNIVIQEGSRYKELNKGAMKTLQSIKKFDPIPEKLGLKSWEIVVPIEYKIS